jgi:DNA-binding transcriptional MerR regulator
LRRTLVRLYLYSSNKKFIKQPAQISLFGVEEPAKQDEQLAKPVTPVEIIETALVILPVFKDEASNVLPATPAPPATDYSAEKIPKKRGRKKKERTWEPKNPGKRGRKSFKEITAEADLVEIPPDEELKKKQYYAIGDVANMFRMNQSLIRLWTNEFDKYFDLKKNKKGDRFFRPEDVKTLYLIYHLIRQRKYTMDGAKDYLKTQKSKAEEQFAMIQSLNKLKDFLLEIKASL